MAVFLRWSRSVIRQLNKIDVIELLIDLFPAARNLRPLGLEFSPQMSGIDEDT